MFFRATSVRLALVILASAVMCGLSRGESNADTPQSGWEVRSFPAPSSGFNLWANDWGTSRLESGAPYPAADASEDAWVKRVQQDTAILRKVLKASGIVLPDRSAVLVDPSTSKFAVRTDPECMELLSAEFDAPVSDVPATLGFTVKGFRADGATARRIAHDLSGKLDASEALRELEGLVAAGKAERLPPIPLETRSGQRGSRGYGSEIRLVTKVAVDEKGNIFTGTESFADHTNLEIDPVLGPDGGTIDLNFAFERPFEAPLRRDVFARHPAGGRLVVAAVEPRAGNVTTAMTIASGTPRLVSIWPVGDAWGKDGHEIVILRGDVVKIASPPSPTVSVETLLQTHANAAVGEPPKIKTPPRPAEDGMRVRRFKAPPGFLGISVSPTDPFATPPPRAGLPTAKDVLASNGVPFPPGASASFNPATSIMLVRNTEAALEQVGAFMDEVSARSPQAIRVTMFIAQAGSEAVRGIAAGTTARAEHAEALAAIEKLVAEGSAQIPVVLSFETRSGQRATLRSSTLHSHADELWPDPLTTEDAARDESKPRTPASTPAAPAIASAAIRQRQVGTMIELDPVIRADGRTVDVNMSLEHHFAPPTPAGGATVTVPANPSLVLPGAEFHVSKLNSAYTLTSGMTKLLGVWKPKGAPEYEGKNVMQAAFLRVDVVPVGKE